MTEHESSTLVKAMCAADSGSGKTGSLCSLIEAGFHVRILDFDNKLSVIRGHVKDKAKLANVHYVDKLQDSFQLTAGKLGIKKAAAFQRAMDALDKGGKEYWGSDTIPPLLQWTQRDILVVDSYSMAGRSALLMVMQANAAQFKTPEIQHYGVAMDDLEKWLQVLMSSAVPCHVIVNTHITGIEGEARLYPQGLGSKGPPNYGKHVDNLIGLRLVAGERKFLTKKDGLLALKTATPLAESYPIATGWVDIFEGLTGKKVQEILA